MTIKKAAIGLALFLAFGSTMIAFAKEDEQSQTVNETVGKPTINSRYSMMNQYGYGDFVRDIDEGDYEAMDEYMNQLSDEDFQKMIDYMRENGYEDMASAMERIGKDGMISMHNAMGEGAGCYR